ncbi:MAG: LysM peptidoglycan-binding domain-containing protein [Lachnospiraceae bacterium]|nr:LysM peptidoglycan-binding domain-containing protein [Lachnospiraceae bacterium]
MRLFQGKTVMGILCGLLVLSGSMVVQAGGNSSYKTRYDVPPEEQDNYTVVTQDLGAYEVCAGDSLWSISEKLLGDSCYYLQIAEQNADVIANPDIIYPQMHLQIKQKVYVRKRTGVNGMKTPEYRFGMPDGWSVGILESGGNYATCSLSGDGMEDVICMIRDKEQAGVLTLSDWENSRQKIQNYVERNYAGQISDLTFYDYQSEDGRNLYLFSYTNTIDGEKYGYRGEMDLYVCHGICQTEHIQAEFTGFDTEEGIEDIILYILASFEEFPGADSVNDYNVAIVPSEPWELAGIHNPFVWIDQYFDAVFSEIAQKNKPAQEKTAKERILGR